MAQKWAEAAAAYEALAKEMPNAPQPQFRLATSLVGLAKYDEFKAFETAPGQKERSQTRISLLKIGPDTIRQLAETTADGGKTWQVSYDLTYTQKR